MNTRPLTFRVSTVLNDGLSLIRPGKLAGRTQGALLAIGLCLSSCERPESSAQGADETAGQGPAGGGQTSSTLENSPVSHSTPEREIRRLLERDRLPISRGKLTRETLDNLSAIRAAFEDWFKTDPEAALERLASIKNPIVQDLIEKNHDLHANHPELVIEFLKESVLDAGLQDLILGKVFSHLANTAPERGIQILRDRFGQGTTKFMAISGLFNSWTSSQPGRIEAALSFEFPEDRRRAFMSLRDVTQEEIQQARAAGLEGEPYQFLLKRYATAELSRDSSPENLMTLFRTYPGLAGQQHLLFSKRILPVLEKVEFTTPEELRARYEITPTIRGLSEVVKCSSTLHEIRYD